MGLAAGESECVVSFFVHRTMDTTNSMLSHRYIANATDLPEVIATLRHYSHVAVDCEGRDLSRDGELTILIAVGFDGNAPFFRATLDDSAELPAYVIDFQEIGREDILASGIQNLLEDAAITKYFFDCRNDSDALFHQFRIRLNNVMDLQVLDQMGMSQSSFGVRQPCIRLEFGETNHLPLGRLSPRLNRLAESHEHQVLQTGHT
jgi:hypothetical protein